MSENKVAGAISQATSVLNSAFGTNSNVQGREEFRYLQEDVLTEIYLNELEQKSLSQFLSDIPGKITKMRSSYLSVDLAEQTLISLESSLNQIISDSPAIKESYENAFLRMMGMPSSSAVENSQNIYVVNSNGEKIEVSYDLVVSQILDERQLPRKERKILVTNNIFNMFEEEFENSSLNNPNIEIPAEEGTTLFTTKTEAQEELVDGGQPNISKIEDELYQYSYLLIPPIQDARISECINEPSKIVPQKFSNPRGWQINSSSLQPSLLESVIRIRLDKFSGQSTVSLVEISEGEEAELTPGDYGVLESLFIIRLRAALKALAIKVGTDIDALRELYEQTGRIPYEEERIQGDPRQASEYEQTTSGSNNQDQSSEELLDKQRIIEDSIMALLDDNSEALDLQIQTQRNTSIKKSHIISSLIGVIDLPRQRLRRKTQDINDKKNRTSRGVGDGKRGDVDFAIGATKGIGVVDILVFVLALFTIDEANLLGLMSDLEFQKYQEEFGEVEGGKVNTEQAVNELTNFLLAGYDLFREDLRNSDLL